MRAKRRRCRVGAAKNGPLSVARLGLDGSKHDTLCMHSTRDPLDTDFVNGGFAIARALTAIRR